MARDKGWAVAPDGLLPARGGLAAAARHCGVARRPSAAAGVAGWAPCTRAHVPCPSALQALSHLLGACAAVPSLTASSCRRASSRCAVAVAAFLLRWTGVG